MLSTCLNLLILVAASAPSSAVSPDPKTLIVPPGQLKKAQDLVRKLGSEVFADREEAEEALAALGRLARPALLEGVTTNPNAEVRTRCEGLLPRATAQEMRARMEVFLADVQGNYEHDLPGWNQFRAKVCGIHTLLGIRVSGDRPLQKAAKAVFVDLISNPENKAIVLATSCRESELNALVINRRMVLSGTQVRVRGNLAVAGAVRRETTVDDVAALLFAESFATQQVAGRVPRQISVTSMISRSGFSTAARDTDGKSRVYKAIAAAWLESRNNPLDLYQGINLATSIGLSDLSLRMAVRLIEMPGAPVPYRANSVYLLTQSGNRDFIKVLEKSFNDTGEVVVFRGGPGGAVEQKSIQMRDVALAACIELAGQNPKEFGFADCSERFAYPSQYQLTDDNRAPAFEKWNAWRTKHKDGK